VKRHCTAGQPTDDILRRMRIERWLPKATNTHSKHIILLPVALRSFQFDLGFHMVSEQFSFSRMGLSAPCPTSSYPGGPMFSVGVVSLS
jgi:hypothetical protein